MQEYHKIETIFERDEKTKKLIVGKYRNSTVEFLRNCDWQFTEKVDGTNIRVHWDGHKVEFGGRTDKAQIPSHLLNKLEELFGGYENEQIFEQRFGEKDVILFGEGYGPKIQKGEEYRNDVSFILFDVMINGYYQPRVSVEYVASYFGVDVVPIVLEGNLQQGIDYVLNQRNSLIATNGALLEGLVARPKMEMNDRMGNRVIVKIKFRDFKDIDCNETLKRKPESLDKIKE